MTIEDYKAGELLLFNKPLKWTSFGVVSKVRWLICNKYGIKKLKVGHAGTLDPLATGLLILCTGKMTKQIENYQAQEKEYIAEACFGATTPSYDLETEIDQTFSTESINKENIENTLMQFLGEYEQMPPIFSAKKVNGKPAYEYARKSQEVKLNPKKVTFHDIKLLQYGDNEAVIRIKCSKGTYIRSFAHDLGKKLNSGAYLKNLQRTQIGKFCVKDAWILQDYVDYVKDKKSSN